MTSNRPIPADVIVDKTPDRLPSDVERALRRLKGMLFTKVGSLIVIAALVSSC